MKNELEQYLQKIHKELYSFTYAMLPDNLQASQIILDTVTVLLLDRSELVETYDYCRTDEDRRNTLESIRMFLYKHIYGLIKKRSEQLQGSIEIDQSYSEFQTLSLLEKAVTYFKSKTELDFDDIAYILDESKTEIFQALANGRNNLAVNSGLNMQGRI